MALVRSKSNEQLRQYAGKWVAMRSGKVLVSADTLPHLMTKVRSRKLLEKVSVMLVPRKEEGPYILFHP